MSNTFEDIPEPTPPPGIVSGDEVAQGPRIPPQQQIILYSSDQWEAFIEEWVHFCLKKLYIKVQRFTGPGDRGIDIAGFADSQQLQGAWDNYQCKHYDRALRPTDAWPEIGKILWYTFKKDYEAPRRYYFVAPRGVGTALAGLLADASKLKNELKNNWDKHVRHSITKSQEIKLEGAFLTYVNAFDFSIFDAKTALEIIEGHRNSPYYAARFGGGLPPRPVPLKPPTDIAPSESRYVAQLLSAYADHKKQAVHDVKTLKSWPKLSEHFVRQREAFYHAESLRVFARDSVPQGTFESLQDDIHDGVIDTHDAVHPDGYIRVCEVTKAARELQLTSNALITRTKPKDRDGICHQLANEDRLQWMKPQDQDENHK